MIYRHTGPRWDHVQLDAAEQRALLELEESFRASGPGDGHPPRRARRAASRVGRRIVHLAPWLFPLGTLLMMLSIPESVVLSSLGALVAGVGLAAGLRRAAAGLRRHRRRRRAAPAP
jgi:hypothetical protein